MTYFTWRNGEIAGVPAKIARTGYTGEDGFEFYASNEHIVTIWDALVDAGQDLGIVPVGLGARDTLRLEARMPLYGQELGDTSSLSKRALAGPSSWTRAISLAATPWRRSRNVVPSAASSVSR